MHVRAPCSYALELKKLTVTSSPIRASEKVLARWSADIQPIAQRDFFASEIFAAFL